MVSCRFGAAFPQQKSKAEMQIASQHDHDEATSVTPKKRAKINPKETRRVSNLFLKNWHTVNFFELIVL